MDEFDTLPLEVRLSAYLDGQVTETQKQAIDDLLAEDEQARELLATLKAGSDFGMRAFEDMLAEPVPLDMVRSIKAHHSAAAASVGSGGAREPANNNVFSFVRFVPQAIAASAILLLAGGYSGYFLARQAAPQQSEIISETSGIVADAPAPVAKTRGLTFDAAMPSPVAEESAELPAAISFSEIADIHRIMTSAGLPMDEVPAAREKDLLTYLEKATSVEFNVPDLASSGFRFRGGKLVAASGHPAGALYYENDAGHVAAVYLLNKAEIGGVAVRDRGFAMVGGVKDSTAYFVAAPDEAIAQSLEQGVRAAL